MAHATIRDVARAASVSVASASRALNGHSSVLPATRTRILDAARELAYVPHAGARSLSTARAHAIGVVLPDLHGEYFSELVRGMVAAARARGFQLLLSNMHADPAQAAVALGAMRGRVDGLVIMAPDLAADALAASLPRGLPVVLVNAPAIAVHPSLDVENRAAATAMVRYLVETGRRRIAHIAGPMVNREAVARRDGFLAAVAEAGVSEAARVFDGDFDEAAGTAVGRHLAAEPALADAVFAANDNMAIGCLLALRDAGIGVPDRIAVAGFDDIPAARYITPALTTMRVDIADLGGRAMERLLQAIAGEPGPQHQTLHPELVIRASTGLANARHTRTKQERVRQ